MSIFTSFCKYFDINFISNDNYDNNYYDEDNKYNDFNTKQTNYKKTVKNTHSTRADYVYLKECFFNKKNQKYN